MKRFIKIPNSEGYTYNGITSEKGWAVAVGGMTFFNENTELYYGGARYDKAPKGALVSCIPGRAPINMITPKEARYAAKNLLVDENGERLEGGGELDFGLWKLLLKDIVKVEENYHDGKLYVGNVNGERTLPLPANYKDSDGYDGVEEKRKRRYFILSTGERIWDLAGNLYEIFADRHNGKDEGGEHIASSLSITGEDLRGRDGGQPWGYNIVNESSLSVDGKFAAFYGGHWGYTTASGVFTSIWGSYDPASHRYSYIGFRCVVPIQ